MSRNIRSVRRGTVVDTSFYPAGTNIDPYSSLTRPVPRTVCATTAYCPMPYDTRLFMLEEMVKKMQCQINDLNCTVEDQEKQICELQEVSQDHSCKLNYLREVTCEQGKKIETLHCYYCDQEKRIDCLEQQVCKLDKTVCCQGQAIECLEKSDCEQNASIEQLQCQVCQHEKKINCLQEEMCEVNKKLEYLRCTDCKQNERIDELDCQVCELNKRTDHLKCSDCNQNVKIGELDCQVCEQNKAIDCLNGRVDRLECCEKKNICEINNCCPPTIMPDASTSMKPPLVFDGYSVIQKSIYSSCGSKCYWFLVPATACGRVVYRFSYNNSLCKYVYEPVNCSDYSVIYPPSPGDAVNVTFIYDNLSGDCYSLVQYVYNGRLATPLTIPGYNYGPINLACNLTTFGFTPCQPMYANGFNLDNCCFDTPCNTQCAPCNTPCNVPVTYVFSFAPLFDTVGSASNEYAVLSNLLDSTDYNYPISVSSLTACNIAGDVVPLASGIGIALPLDTCTYRVTYTGELRVNTGSNSLSVPYIDYLAGSGSSTNSPARVRLQVRYVDQNGVFIENSGSEISFNWSAMCTNGSTSTPPANFLVRTNTATGQNYYLSCLNNQEVAAIISYPPSALSPTGVPYGRRILTFASDPAFSISSITLKISKIV